MLDWNTWNHLTLCKNGWYSIELLVLATVVQQRKTAASMYKNIICYFIFFFSYLKCKYGEREIEREREKERERELTAEFAYTQGRDTNFLSTASSSFSIFVKQERDHLQESNHLSFFSFLNFHVSDKGLFQGIEPS